MAAIITDQLRIKNARSFIDKIRSSTDSFYTFIGLPNATENKTGIRVLLLPEIVLMTRIFIGIQ